MEKFFKKPVAFIVKMSNKVDIQIDQDEVEKVARGIMLGQPIIVRQGIVNPSFYSAIIEDKDRISVAVQEMRYVEQYNKYNEKKKVWSGMKSLRDIFEEVPELKKLTEPRKAIGN